MNRSFIDRIPALAWSALADGSLEFFYLTSPHYTGLSSDQLHGTAWKSAVFPDDIRQFEAWWQDLRQTQAAGMIELRLRRFDGDYRWFQISHKDQGRKTRPIPVDAISCRRVGNEVLFLGRDQFRPNEEGRTK